MSQIEKIYKRQLIHGISKRQAYQRKSCGKQTNLGFNEELKGDLGSQTLGAMICL